MLLKSLTKEEQDKDVFYIRKYIWHKEIQKFKEEILFPLRIKLNIHTLRFTNKVT